MSAEPPPLPAGVREPPPVPPQLEPHGSTRFAGELTDRGRGRVFPCPNCGADLTFDIGSQGLKCPFCGHEEPVEPPADAAIEERGYEAMLETLRERHERGADGTGTHQYEGMREVRCRSCGGTVLFRGTTVGTECPYCASPIQIDAAEQAKDRIAVDALLPFKVDHDRAGKHLAAWVASRWFAPNDFRRRGVKGKFNGVYFPFWTFDSLTHTRYSGQRGEHYTVTVGSGKNRRTVTRTRWYPASGSFERFFDDTLVAAGEGVNPGLIRSLEPWPLPDAAPYDQRLLAGFLTRTYDIELAEGFRRADERMRQALTHDVRRRIGGDVQRIASMEVRHRAITFKHVLLPVWLMAYRYRDAPHQVVVNAVTGRVSGERPYSWVKIFFAVLAGLIAAGVLWVVTNGGGVRVR